MINLQNDCGLIMCNKVYRIRSTWGGTIAPPNWVVFRIPIKYIIYIKYCTQNTFFEEFNTEF